MTPGINTEAFVGFQKIARLSREIVVSEKIDGTCGVISIGEDGKFQIGSRNRWLTPETGNNHGFMMWALTHKEELMELGPGRHFGEWWGHGIQRGYGLKEKRFSLFNTSRWVPDGVELLPKQERPPACCGVVPVLWHGIFDTAAVEDQLELLSTGGSVAAPGFMNPEGVVVYHIAGNVYFKKYIIGDDAPKSIQ